MKKIIFIVISFIIFFLLLEFSIYSIFVYKQKQMVASTNFDLPNEYNYSFKYNFIDSIINSEYTYRKKVSFGNNQKILIFGCSYAYGAQLEEEDTFGYKLAKKLNATVYNRSFPGLGLQHMYYQINNNSFDNYVQDKNIDSIIYVYMDDHINRLYSAYWGSPFQNIFNIRYCIKNEKLKKFETRFPFINILFITKGIRNIAYKQYSKTNFFNKNSNELTLKLLNESHKELKAKYPNAQFILLDYLGALSTMQKEIDNTGWSYVSTTNILPENINLRSNEYHFENDPHPTGKAWDIIVDSIVKKRVLYWRFFSILLLLSI